MTTSTKFDVGVEASFELGVAEGRKQMAKLVLELFKITNSTDQVSRILETLENYNKEANEIKQFLSMRAE